MAEQNPAIPPHRDNTDGLWLLSLDGGGVRGLSTLYILRNIMYRLNEERRENKLHRVKPCDAFDLIGGTSTGGIIAIMLGRLEMDVDDCITTYLKLMKTLFKRKSSFSVDWRGKLKGKFSSLLLEQVITEVIRERGHSATDLFNDERQRKCKVMVCAKAAETNFTTRLRSYTLRHDPNPGTLPTITQAAMATSAAVSFFDPVVIGSRKFLDGGLGSNNPVDEVEDEACELWCRSKGISELQQRTKCFITIGTGHPGNKAVHNKATNFVLSTLKDMATETETTARKSEHKWRQQVKDSAYFRFNVEHGLGDVGLEEFQKAGVLEATTDAYLRTRTVQDMLDSCTRALGDKQYVMKTDNSSSADTLLLELYHPSRFARISAEWALTYGKLCENIFNRISDYLPDRVYQSIKHERCEGTTTWFLDKLHEKHPSWIHTSSGCLWLSGTIGSGKTFITATVIEELSTSQFVGHFFFRPSDGSQMTATSLVRAFILEMVAYLDYRRLGYPRSVELSLTRLFGPDAQPPSFSEIFKECFLRLHQFMIERRLPVFYIVDGLHECDSQEIELVLYVLQELLSLGNARVMISGRESLAISNFIPGTIKVTISEEDTREDIREFIDWKMASKRHGPLKRNKELARSVANALNERAKLMFLWVSLQLKSVLQCKTDEDVRATLRDLPPDLDSLYANCVMRLNSSTGQRVLRWAYATIRPFKIAHLCEALAIDIKSGKLQQDQIEDKDVILEDCFNLVYFNVNDEVVLVHHSLHQFLSSSTDTRSPKWNLDVERLKLGELYPRYLTGPDYSLTVEHRSSQVALSFHATTFMQQTFPILQGWHPSPVKPPHQVMVNPQSLGVIRRWRSGLPCALDHARQSWLPLTQHLQKSSDYWSMFLDLALHPSEQFDFHPWKCQSQSIQAHYSKLLGWAIANSHIPLLHALGQATPEPMKEMYDLPLPDYNNLLPIHLAARTLSKETNPLDLRSHHEYVFTTIWNHCVNTRRDENGFTTLHHAADADNEEVLRKILHLGRIDIESMDNSKRTALAIAAINGRNVALSMLIKLGAECDKPYDVANDPSRLQFPIMGAVQQGHLSTVDILLNCKRPTGLHAVDSLGRTALHYAALYQTKHSGSIVQVLLRAMARHRTRDVNGKKPIDLACATQNVAAAASLLEPSNAFQLGLSKCFWPAVKRGDQASIRTFMRVGETNGSRQPLLNAYSCQQLEEMFVDTSRADLWGALQDEGINLNAVDSSSRSLLMWAVLTGSEKLLDVLLRESVDRTLQDENGSTALHHALQAGTETSASTLISRGNVLELNIPDHEGFTPLSMLLLRHNPILLFSARQWSGELGHANFDIAGAALKNPALTYGKSDKEVAQLFVRVLTNIGILHHLTPHAVSVHVQITTVQKSGEPLALKRTAQIIDDLITPASPTVAEENRKRINCSLHNPIRTVSYKHQHLGFEAILCLVFE